MTPVTGKGTTNEIRSIMNAIRRIIHALQVGSHASQKTIGLSGAQLFVLQILASRKVMSVNELAIGTCTHQSSVSTVVSRLVEAGLAKRSVSTTDGRRVDLSVTSAGRRLLAQQIVTPQETMIAALRRLPDSRLTDLRSLLEEVISESRFDSEPAPMFFERESEAAAPATKRAKKTPPK